jgi:PAS domain S-box-containing protein
LSEAEATSHLIVDSSASSSEALRESHELLALATEAAQAGWGTWDLRTDESSWDERGKKIMGFADDSEAGTAEGWLSRVHPEDRPKVEAHVARCIAEDLDFGMDYRIIRADGRTRNIRATGRFKKAEDGTALRATVLVIDATERKKAEEESKESEQKFVRQLLRHFPNGSVNVFDRALRYVLAEGQGLAQVGLSSEVLVGKTLDEVFSKEAVDVVKPYYRRAFAREAVQFELPVADDVYSINAAPLQYGEDGEVHTIIAVAQNITERKRAEEALKESEERLQRAIAIETVGVIFFKAEGQITEANDAFLRMSGYGREDLAEGLLRWDVMTPPEWMPRSLEAVEELQTTGRTTPYEKEYIRKDGSRWWGLFAATRLGEEESVEFVIDVTGRKRAEEERERLIAHELTTRAQAEERRRLSRELHDRVAHDIALVHQSLELHEVLKTTDPERAAAKMELASRTVKEALESTRDLSMELREPEVRRGLEAALANLLRDIVPPTVESNLSVEGDEALVPPEVRNQLFLILREAIRNAVTHSGTGRIAVELDVGRERVAGRVEDDGGGFDPDEIRTAASGGLRAMEERAALVGATLDLSSAPGRGTTIKVSIPLGDA